jgi:hypothetical protein
MPAANSFLSETTANHGVRMLIETGPRRSWLQSTPNVDEFVILVGSRSTPIGTPPKTDITVGYQTVDCNTAGAHLRC